MLGLSDTLSYAVYVYLCICICVFGHQRLSSDRLEHFCLNLRERGGGALDYFSGKLLCNQSLAWRQIVVLEFHSNPKLALARHLQPPNIQAMRQLQST